MGRYVKKGGHGGSRHGAGRKKTLQVPDIDRYFAVERFREAWRRECEKAETSRPLKRLAKRLLANWHQIGNVPLHRRQLVLELAEKDELPPNTPHVVATAVRALKKTRTILDRRGRVRAATRAYSKRRLLLERFAAEETKRYRAAGLEITITGDHLQDWCDDYEKLREKVFPRKLSSATARLLGES